jgi:hypothetical protein
MRFWFVLMFAAAGCLSLPDRPGPEDGCRDGQVLQSRFETSECEPWGQSYGNTDFENVGGRLRLTPQSTGQSAGGCIADNPSELDDRGIFLEVPAIPASASGSLAILLDDGDPLMVAYGGALTFRLQNGPTYGEKLYDAAAMRWWRMRPDRARNELVGEYSADGHDWIELGRSPELPVMVQIKIEAGVDDVEPTPGYAEIDNLDACVF